MVNRKNKKAIEEYIRKQLQEDIATDQISIKEYVDSFEKEEKEKEIPIKVATILLINKKFTPRCCKNNKEVYDMQ